MIKPDWVTWEDISECQRKAHATNEAKGFHMKVQDMTGEEIKNFIGDGVCFVALDGSTVVGTIALAKRKLHRWWTNNQTMLLSCMSAVLPEYRGSEVFIELDSLKNDFWNQSDSEILYFSTAESNKVIQKMALRTGAKYVQFSASGRNANHYSVILARWKHGCPYSDTYLNIMYNLSKYFVKLLWKPGYKFRFWF